MKLEIIILFALSSTLSPLCLGMDSQDGQPLIPWHTSTICSNYLKGPRIREKNQDTQDILHNKRSNLYHQLQREFYCLIQNNIVNLAGTDSEGFTLVHRAAARNRSDIIYYLYERKINCDEYSSSGLTPLHVAAQRSSIETIEALLECRADINKRTNFLSLMNYDSISFQY